MEDALAQTLAILYVVFFLWIWIVCIWIDGLVNQVESQEKRIAALEANWERRWEP